jgi:phosphoglycerate dehydrogenase-like enzyme
MMPPMAMDDDTGLPRPPVIAVAPVIFPQVVELIQSAGGVIGSLSEADAVIWTDPDDPEGFADLVVQSPARWVQLPFAGVDSLALRGLLDDRRLYTSAKGVYGPSVAEHALGMMLGMARGIVAYARKTSWTSPDGVAALGARRLTGQRVLIVGTGGIGRSLARMLEPHEPTILAVNRSGTPMPGATRTAPVTELGTLVGQVDWVVLALPLTAASRGLFDRAMFQKMSRQAWLVNVARGEIVVTADLVEALASGGIAGAALDVTDPEPLPDGHPLWGFPNVLVTPHVANTWDMAVIDLGARIARNIIAFAHGQPLEGVVDVNLGY